MEAEKEAERLKFSIERFDHYYDSVNNKSTVMLTLSTFIVGGLVAAYPAILEKVNCGICIHLLMSLLLGLGVAVMIIVTHLSIPHLGGRSDSLIFFGDIAGFSQKSFKIQSVAQQPDEAMDDLRNQTYFLAKGLESKFRKLQVVGYLMIFQFTLFIPLFILLIANLKK